MRISKTVVLAVLVLCCVCYGKQKGPAVKQKDFVNPLTSPDVDWKSKSIPEWMKQAQQTRQDRIKDAFEFAAGGGVASEIVPFTARLYLGNDLDKVNEELYAILSSTDPNVRAKYHLQDHWSLGLNQTFYQMYYRFGSKGDVFKGRLYPKTEKALLAELWDRTNKKNDIVLARQNTWWMQGSENHDLVEKVSNLITSQIFMDEPDYAQRVFPDTGHGGGTGFWFHQMYGSGTYEGPDGRANYADGKKYIAKDHYKAWVKFFKEYIDQRAQRGFFLEMAAPGYMQTSITHLTDIYDLCNDKELKETAGKFLDLVWLEWSQDEINGIRGGAKTRVPNGCRHMDSMYCMMQYYLGGKGTAEGNCYTQFFSSYQVPELVWYLALDREGMGCFEYISRKIGEEQGITPRPLGMERSLMCDTFTRFVRYSYVTPDYILGTQMDHPLAVHSHLSVASRWQGITFNDRDGARVYPTDIIEEKGHWKEGKNYYYRSAQYKNVLITQQCRRWNMVSPDWFPMDNTYNLPMGVYFGKKKLDEIIEKAGWIFVRHGDAYLAIRPLLGKFHQKFQVFVDKSLGDLYEEIDANCYTWNPERDFIKFKDNFSPVIMEAGRKADYKTFDAFMNDILDNTLKLQRTVVPGFYVVIYKGSGSDAKEIVFNAANNEVPTIGGKYIDYAPDFLFSSPYLKSKYNSGVIWAGYKGKEMKLKF